MESRCTFGWMMMTLQMLLIGLHRICLLPWMICIVVPVVLVVASTGKGSFRLPALRPFFYISQAIHLTAAILLNVIIIIIKVRCRPIGLPRWCQCCPCLDEWSTKSARRHFNVNGGWWWLGWAGAPLCKLSCSLHFAGMQIYLLWIGGFTFYWNNALTRRSPVKPNTHGTWLLNARNVN